MTLLGKILVLFNLAASVIGAIWALLLFTNNVDWSNTAPKTQAEAPEVPAGKLWQPEQEINVLVAHKSKVRESWKAARAVVLAQDATRRGDRGWYEAELKHLSTRAKADQPARDVEYNDKYFPAPDAANFNRPKMVPVNYPAEKPLQSLSYYQEELVKTMKELVEVRDQYTTKLNEDIALTNKILGGGEGADDDPKGLRQRLIDERNKRIDLWGEERLVQPLETNAEVESELILRRRDSLRRRLRQLDDYLRRKHGVPTRPDADIR